MKRRGFIKKFIHDDLTNISGPTGHDLHCDLKNGHILNDSAVSLNIFNPLYLISSHAKPTFNH
ncbi:MAG: hypothetical protein ABIY90_14715 [Puia sp.]